MQRSACSAVQRSAVQGRAVQGKCALVCWHAILSSRLVIARPARRVSSRGTADPDQREKKKSRTAQKGADGRGQEGRGREDEEKYAPCRVRVGAHMACHGHHIYTAYIEVSRLVTYARPNKQTNKQTNTNERTNKRERGRERYPSIHPSIHPSPPVRRASSSHHLMPRHAIASQVENMFRRAPLLRREQRKHIPYPHDASRNPSRQK
jgi:hypothetical protein